MENAFLALIEAKSQAQMISKKMKCYSEEQPELGDVDTADSMCHPSLCSPCKRERSEQ